MLILQDF
jgi:N-acetyltransferase 10